LEGGEEKRFKRELAGGKRGNMMLQGHSTIHKKSMVQVGRSRGGGKKNTGRKWPRRGIERRKGTAGHKREEEVGGGEKEKVGSRSVFRRSKKQPQRRVG